MATWANDIVTALENLGGSASYDDIYKEVSKIRSNLPKSWVQIIQRTIQDKSSDSEGYKGGENLFEAVNGLGSGVWGLRKQYTKEEIEKLINSIGELEPPTFEKHQEKFNIEVELSKKDTPKNRIYRLKNAPLLPNKIEVTVSVYNRNPDVVAEVLLRANGCCEKCKNPAPFLRAKDNTPFLEVHHIKQLAHGGQDSVQNTLALCPNCHKELHYGK